MTRIKKKFKDESKDLKNSFGIEEIELICLSIQIYKFIF